LGWIAVDLSLTGMMDIGVRSSWSRSMNSVMVSTRIAGVLQAISNALLH
jgi:hypothetical protein